MLLKILVLVGAVFTSFCTTYSQAQVLHEYQELLPDSRERGSDFGRALESNGEYIAVFAPNAGLDGVLYIFDAISGDLFHEISAEAGGFENNTGIILSMNETQLAVGSSIYDRPNYFLNSVTIIDLDSGERVSQFSLNLDHQIPYHGSSDMVLSGDMVIIGADTDSDVGFNSGAIYIIDSSTGELVQKNHPSTPAEFGYFGYSLDIHDNVLAVMSLWGAGSSGHPVYLYDLSTLEEISFLPADDGEFSRSFVNSMAMNDQYIAMASWSEGVVMVYSRATNELLSVLHTEDGFTNDYHLFGIEIDLDGDLLLVSSTADSQNGNWAGAAYIFHLPSGTQLAKLLPDAEIAGYEFGHSIAFSNGQAVIAERNDYYFGSYTGSVYLLDMSSIHLCSPDFDDNGQLNTTDIELFINQYTNNDPSADFDVDGLFNFYDISEFIHEFTTGCP